MDPSIFQSRFYKQILSKDSITILSAADDGVAFGQGTTKGTNLDQFRGSVNVFTERLTLCPEPTHGIAIQTGTSAVVISASEVSVAGESQAFIKLDGASGVPNDAGNAAGRDATNGSNGKVLNMFVSSVTKTLQQLSLDASGGNGATTADLGVPAGSGGSGGCIEVLGLSSMSVLYDNLLDFQQDHELPKDWTPEERDAALPLSATDEIIIQATGLAELAARLCSRQDTIEAAVIGKLSSLARVPNTATIFDVARAVRTAAHIIKKNMNDEGILFRSHCVARGGSGGKATLTALARGTNGKDGLNGSVDVNFMSSMRGLQPSFPIAHPVQCQMLLEKARAYFYFGNDHSLSLARNLLESCLIRTGLYASLEGEALDKQIRLLNTNKSALGLSSADGALQQLREIDRTARSLLFQLTNTSLDYYCRRQNWVPRRAVSKLESEAHKSLEDLRRIEKLFLVYDKAVKDLVQHDAQRQQVVQELDTSQAMIDSHVEEMRDVLISLRRSIKDPQTNLDIERMTKEITPLLENLSQEIFTTFKLTPTQLCDAVKAIASEPSKATAAKEVGKLAWQGLTKVPNKDGDLIDKDLLLSKLETMNGNLRDNLPKLMESAKMSEQGFLVSNDSSTALVVANTQQMEDMLNDFGQDSFGGKATMAQTKLRQYLKLVTDRNADIVQYNVVLKELFDSRSKKMNLKQRQASAEADVFKSQDIGQISAMADLTADIHNYARERCMRLLTLYRRSIFFSTLSDPDILAMGGLQNDAALNLTVSKLADIKTKLHDRLEDLREKKGSDAPRFPADYENASGKFVTLSSAQLKDLLKSGRLHVTLPAVRRGSKLYPDFNGRADVRLYRARFWLDGLSVRDRATWAEDEQQNNDIPVSISLKHCGDSQFASVYDEPMTFSHDEINVNWLYRLHHNAAGSPANGLLPQAVDSGDVVNYSAVSTSNNDAYAAPSPFATWVVSLEDLDPRLDLSTVTRARFEFFGTSRKFV